MNTDFVPPKNRLHTGAGTSAPCTAPAPARGSTAVDTDVLIVGGGPIGLLLANLLGLRGVRTRVVDRRDTPLDSSMAIGITPPSLEILRKLGLDRVFQEAGVPVRHAEVHEQRTLLGRLDFAGIASDYPFFLSIPQARTVEILRANVAKFPSVEVINGVDFTGLAQEFDSVRVALRSVASEVGFETRCRFLIGCDGHRSLVRDSAGLTVSERIYPQQYVMADFTDRSGLGDEARLFFTPEASVESFPLPGGWRRWIVLAGEFGDEAPAEYLIRRIRQLTGYNLGTEPVRFVSTFGAKRMIVDRYHAGRVLLAGDAAHVMSSIGGQGMNTGFADAEMIAEVLPRVMRKPAAMAGAFAAYDRVRRAAYEVAADRAERGMWLGTLRGAVGSCFRKHFIRGVLFSRFMEHRLAPHFAMLTIPFRNLYYVPRELLPAD
jgi:2-polyprenyl-6-methoxyphenol hydroxylase-like FAD-dependent oxidoreductase